MSIQQQQLLIIGQQLGREPRGLVDIAACSTSGVPLVLQMRSQVDDQPFPTLYWLCSKDLCKAIGQIEGHGWVKRIEARLQEMICANSINTTNSAMWHAAGSGVWIAEPGDSTVIVHP